MNLKDIFFVIVLYKSSLEDSKTINSLESIIGDGFNLYVYDNSPERQYENDNFGEVLTDLSDPEKIANMLYYIIGNEAIQDLYEYSETFLENENNCATVENSDKIIQDINELL